MQTKLIGRDNNCDIVLYDKTASRHHAQLIYLDNGRVLLKDLGSRNGIFVNGARISETYLKGGDVVMCANALINWQSYFSPVAVGQKLQSNFQQHPISEGKRPEIRKQGNSTNKHNSGLITIVTGIFLILILIAFLSARTRTKLNGRSQLTITNPRGNSNDLTREFAKSRIIVKNKYPYNEIRDFELVFYNVLAGLDVPKYERLQQEGYITYSFDGSWRTAEILEKGKQFVYGQERNEGYGRTYISVRTCVIEFAEITGIRTLPGLNMAEVSYTVRRTNITPFGEIIFELKGGELQKTATFTKYDDGWRINDQD